MSEININQTDLNITVTPNTTTLSVFTGGYACAQGNTTEVQFNNGGVIAGANGLTYDQGSQTTTAANLTVTNNTDLGAIGNITITGGNSGEVLTTDGSGGLSFSEIANANFASFAGNIIEAAQPNITSVGNLSNLTVTGNVTANYFIGNGSQLTGLAEGDEISNGTSNVRVLSTNGDVAIGVNGNANVLVATATGIEVSGANLGNVGNLVITGGNNGFVLQTDGTGNLTWTAMTGNAGNGVVGGSNTQVQYNDGGAFGGSAGFTFDKASNLLSAPGGITAVGNVQGNYILGNGSLLTGIVTSANSIVNGNSNVVVDANSNVRIAITGQANIVDIGLAFATFYTDLEVEGNLVVRDGNVSHVGNGRFTGNAAGLTNIPGANVTGTVANATYATNAGTVTTAAQPNITSLGTLTSLGVSGNITASNIVANTGIFSGNANGLTSIPAGNIVGTVANANYAVTANTVVNASQPNVTSLGTLTGLAVNGNITAANITANTGVFTGNGSGLSAIAGANVTGTVSSATTAGTVTTAAQPNITSVGTLSSLTVVGNTNITGNLSQVSGNSNLANAKITNANITNATIANFYTGLIQNDGDIWINPGAGNRLQISNTFVRVATSLLVDNSVFANTGISTPHIVNGNSGIFITANGNIQINAAGSTNELIITNTGINVVGTLNATGNANVGNIGGNNAVFTLVTGTLTTATQPNITSIGTLTSLAVTGNVTAGNVYANSGTVGANLLTGTLTTTAQPNITSLGTLSDLILSSANGIHLGTSAGLSNQAANSIAIGYQAGQNNLPNQSIAIGWRAGRDDQGISAITLGSSAGSNAQGNYSIAIGTQAGNNSQGSNSIAIGTYAGRNNQPNNTIILNASGQNVNPTTSQATYITPVRNNSSANFLVYDPTTFEVTYSNTFSGNISAANVIGQVSSANVANLVSVQNTNATSNTVFYPIFTSNITSNTGTANLKLEIDNAGNPLQYIPSNATLIFNIARLEKVTNDGGEDIDIDGTNNSIRLSVSGSSNAMVVSNATAILESSKSASAATDTTISHKIPIVLNGTTYYIALTTSV